MAAPCPCVCCCLFPFPCAFPFLSLFHLPCPFLPASRDAGLGCHSHYRAAFFCAYECSQCRCHRGCLRLCLCHSLCLCSSGCGSQMLASLPAIHRANDRAAVNAAGA